MAFIPAATDLHPSAKMARVSTVAAVVPASTPIRNYVSIKQIQMDM
jgi:hypothetical protein